MSLEYYQFFVDAWRFFKRYKCIAVDKSEFYDTVLESAENITKRYKRQRFVVNIMIILVTELEKIARGEENV